MFINIIDQICFSVNGEYGKVLEFIKYEYKKNIIDQPFDKVCFHLDIVEDNKNPIKYIINPPVSYDENGIFIFDTNHRKIRIDFSLIGKDTYHVICDKNFNPDFIAIILEYLIHLSFVNKDAYFCHCCSFSFHNKIILCPAWRNVGKTNLLLSFLKEGAKYLADDWCLIDKNGSVSSLPKRINLLHYNLVENSDLLNQIDPDLIHLVEFFKRALKGQYDLHSDYMNNIKSCIKKRICIEDLFPEQLQQHSNSIDYIFLLTKNIINPERGVYITELEKSKIIIKINEILKFEQRPFRIAYNTYKAITGKKNEFLEKLDETLNTLTLQAFHNVNNIYEVHVPDKNSTVRIKDEIIGLIK